MRPLLWIALSFMLALPGFAEEVPDRAATGGAQTLEDIMARQRGESWMTTSGATRRVRATLKR